jgi:hypothetical protein
MNYIKITSALSLSQRVRLNRRCAKNLALAEQGMLDDCSFVRSGRNQYAPIAALEPADHCEEINRLHAMARRMMVVAGTTFLYNITEGF